MAPPTWDFFLAHGDAAADEAARLHRALQRDARVFSRALSRQPGEGPGVAARALVDAGVVVILLARDGDIDRALGDDFTAAVARVRDDPTRRVVPVFLDAHAKDHPRYGAATLQGLSLHDDGLDAVAAKLREVVAGLRGVWKRRPRVALVGVVAELDAHLRLAEKRLSQGAEVAVLDAATPADVAKAAGYDLRVVFVGARTGGGDGLRTLLDGGASGLRFVNAVFDDTSPEEFAAVQPLRKRVEARDSFATPEEAAARALEHFAAWLRTWRRSEPGGDAALTPWERAYLMARQTKWRAGHHEGLREATRGKTLDRARLYVPLRAEPTPTAHIDAHGAVVVLDEAVVHTRRRAVDHALPEERGQRVGPWLEALVTHRALPSVVVEGEAGAGKTVLLQHLACALTALHLGEAAGDALIDVASLTAGAPLLRVPLLVEARRLARDMESGSLAELLAALAGEVGEHAAQPVDVAALREGLAAGRYLLLVDSLDEVPGVALRERLLAALAALVGQRWPSRLVLTTRPTAYTGLAVSERLRLVRVAPLDDDRTGALIDRWADAMGELPGYRRDARGAVDALRAREHGLVANPLLLTCTLLVYDQERLLPDSLAELYERLVEILCRAKPTPGLGNDAKREVLERVCEAMQRAGSTAIESREAAEVLLRANPELGTVDAALAALDRVAADTGLLRFETARREGERRERRVVRPWHRSFQEFLAARRLAAGRGAVDAETDALLAGPSPVALDPAWENVLTFLVGVYANQGSERARAYAERLTARGCAEDAARPGRLLGLAARGVAEYRDLFTDGALRDRLREAIAGRFAREGARWPLRDRLLALEALGRLGDPRLDEDWWVDVPGATFPFGDGESVNSRKPRRVTVAGFRMSWRPVTVADYAPFVDAGAYGDPAYWEAVPDDERFEEPEGWAVQRFHPGRPVVGVSLHEARAWCRWASAQRGEVIALPTEEEWEFAARGPTGDVFPWGDDEPGEGDAARANHDWGDGAVGDASPVGAFPRGDRGRLVDLAGNVWEWTESVWQEDDKPVETMTNGAPRVVRGGAWSYRARDLRCATRGRIRPGSRSQGLGFRVVVRVSRQPR